MARKRVRMSNVDTAWWHMEEPTNLMTITTLMVFGGRPNYEQMIQTIAARLLRFDRFRQRVVEPLAPWSANDRRASCFSRAVSRSPWRSFAWNLANVVRLLSSRASMSASGLRMSLWTSP